MEEGVCYVNGSFVPASEAKVSIFDRGFTSGEGVSATKICWTRVMIARSGR